MVTLIRIGVPWVIIGDERERPYNKRGACLLKCATARASMMKLHCTRLTSAVSFFFFSFLFVWRVSFFFFTRRGVSIESTGKELKFGDILSS